jgi:hypothetical protein
MRRKLLTTLALAATLVVPTVRAEETNHWTFDVTLYGLAASMSGDVAVKGIPANNVDIGFDKIWDNLNFGAMGTVRVGYDRWAFSTDVIYMDVGATKEPFSLEVKQLMVQPVIEYRVHRQVTVFAGAVYNRIDMQLSGPIGRNPSDAQGWWDPIVGTQLSLPLGKHFSLNVRGDVGGFGLGSDLAWEAYPYVSWQFAKWGALQLGYRWISVDYETGSGRNRFKYDMVSQGPQLGVTITF